MDTDGASEGAQNPSLPTGARESWHRKTQLSGREKDGVANEAVKPGELDRLYSRCDPLPHL